MWTRAVHVWEAPVAAFIAMRTGDFIPKAYIRAPTKRLVPFNHGWPLERTLEEMVSAGDLEKFVDRGTLTRLNVREGVYRIGENW